MIWLAGADSEPEFRDDLTPSDTTVLSLDTGHQRDYSEGEAYRQYFASDELMFAVPELERWLSTGVRTPLLLDARESAEFAVSHLRDAQLTPSAREALALVADTPKNQLIVAYCSVGYRSAALARELATRGFTNVYNLEGSLFEWANRGLPCTGTAARSRRFIPTTGGGSASSTRNSTPSRPALEGLHRMVPSPR